MDGEKRSVNRVAEMVGPVYRADSVLALTGWSESELADRVTDLKALRVTTADGVDLYPVWQFAGGAVRADLLPLMAVFKDSGEDGWLVAIWLNTSKVELDGVRPVEEPTNSLVVQLAWQTVARWGA